jgi:hypothetical protein
LPPGIGHVTITLYQIGNYYTVNLSKRLLVI